MLYIEDGTGTGKKAGVDEDNRLLTHAVSTSDLVKSSEDGNAWAIATDFIALTTTASFSGIIYISNDSDENLEIHKIRICHDLASTENMQVKTLKNPTAGTLISAGTAGTTRTLNFTSSVTSDVTAKIGSDAKTVTDGSLLSQMIIKGVSLHEVSMDEGIILGPSDSLAVVVKPSAACNVCSYLICHR
jgi:hypothetical protein